MVTRWLLLSKLQGDLFELPLHVLLEVLFGKLAFAV
jgi:hypothetical protein